MARAFKLPDLGEGIHEGEVLQVLVSEGDDIQEGNPILEVETDKAAVEIPSPYTGKVKKILVKPGDSVRVGDELIIFDVAEKEGLAQEEVPKAEPSPVEKPEMEKKEPAPPAEAAAKPQAVEGPVPAAPSTRRLARELKVDLHQVSGSGPGGRVTDEDVKSFAAGKGAEKKEKVPEERERAARPLEKAGPELPDFSKWGPVEKVPLRSIRRATARQMALAWSQIPHVNSMGEADVTLLDGFIRKHKADIESKGGRLTLTVFALKAAAAAMRANPRFNASLDPAAGEIILKHYCHIGVAVNTDDGLIVPVLRDVDRKNITELSIELKAMVERTRGRKATLDEMKGGTFTITNVGPMGGGYFAPIINYPEVAILGLGSAKWQPVVKEKPGGGHEILPRLIMPVVLGIDHRILDGADALKFIDMFSRAMGDPEKMLMTV
ncbi:MAG: 2-oxo acid dehydrogenase subunit E2 [Deltaproteobacteria bacterium HGW-Deltaproteobacteria-15]|jgi:pyruvate dehydrogenase E2 component (dihydrolipoamide acetyltransferase)|nr:MAG: 2-oxo acid dehydrogenase subunit E2 [Deltaproteobacteria bacterium HGW-Deltaproteobacteria-15]